MKGPMPLLRIFIVSLLCANSLADEVDEIELEVQSGLMIKMLRDMGNQTAADSLNLPANASTIRENITDTFSCENRTYGYYADVDNDCQIFHVCLPSQTAKGRNITYRWSFICPNETVFNQEVLVCTRPEDAIPCEDSPDYYDLNNEIGKKPNKTRSVEDEPSENSIDAILVTKEDGNPVKGIKKTEQVFPSRNPNKRPVKQNYIVQQLIKDIVDEEMKEKLQSLDLTQAIGQLFPVVSEVNDKEPVGIENRDRIIITDERIDANDKIEFNDGDVNEREEFFEKDVSEKEDFDEREGERLILGRSMGRNLRRGLLRFKADV